MKEKLGSNVKIGYLSQHVFLDIEDKPVVIDVFQNEVHVTEGKARQHLARFLFCGYTVF